MAKLVKTLSPEMAEVLDAIGSDPYAAMFVLPTEQAVARLRQTNVRPSIKLVDRIEDRLIPARALEIPVRIYWPHATDGLPILLNFHGGGWMLGSVAGDDQRCQRLAISADCIVISVDYRLAPEHRYPAGFEDCFAACEWAHGMAATLGGDPSRIAVGGASAGANLAAAVALRARDEGMQWPHFQLLLYPVIDGSRAPSEAAHGDEVAGGPYFLTRRAMEWHWQQYATPEQRLQSYASPSCATDLSGLPPAMILIAELDPLAAEGHHYAARLREAGVAVEIVEIPGVTHGFLSLGPELQATSQALELSAAALRSAFGKS